MGPTIFISIASYLDPVLFFTLREAYAKAKNPECLRFGVVDQHVENNRAQIAALPFASQIRYVHVSPQDTLGVSWARSVAFSLYDGEDFLLQIDSHTLFEQDWDETLLTQYWELLPQSKKHILSTYPHPFEMVDGQPEYKADVGKSVLVLRPHPDTPLSRDNAVLRFRAYHYMSTDHPVMGCHVAGGFLFAAGSFVNEVPYDPFLYFHGEEQSLAVRAFTRGWNIYHPVHIPLRHLYKVSGTAYQNHHWHGQVAKQRAFSHTHLTERARKRLTDLLIHNKPLGAYGLGTERTMEQYTEMSGIDYRRATVTDVFGGKLK